MIYENEYLDEFQVLSLSLSYFNCLYLIRRWILISAKFNFDLPLKKLCQPRTSKFTNSIRRMINMTKTSCQQSLVWQTKSIWLHRSKASCSIILSYYNLFKHFLLCNLNCARLFFSSNFCYLLYKFIFAIYTV